MHMAEYGGCCSCVRGVGCDVRTWYDEIPLVQEIASFSEIELIYVNLRQEIRIQKLRTTLFVRAVFLSAVVYTWLLVSTRVAAERAHRGGRDEGPAQQHGQ